MTHNTPEKESVQVCVMSTNPSLHGQGRLLDTLVVPTRCTETPSMLLCPIHTLRMAFTFVKICDKCIFLQYVLQHNPYTVNMWRHKTHWNNLPLMLQFRDLHSPGVDKHTRNINQTQRDEYHISLGAIKSFSTNALMIFYLSATCKSIPKQQLSNIAQLERWALKKIMSCKSNRW